jgi:drug/metabolite transporter (DMT)-like permease
MWVFFALGAAVASAVSRTFIKSAAPRTGDHAIVFVRSAIAVIPSWLCLFLMGVPTVQPGFIPAVFGACIVDAMAIVCMSRSLRSASMGNAVPLLAFTPVFLLFTGHLIVAESPTLAGIAGVVVIVIGSYFLRLGRRDGSLLTPFRLLWEGRGPRYMLGAALLFSLASPLFKRAILCSGPIFTMSVSLPLSCLLIGSFHLLTGKTFADLLPDRQNWKALLGLGGAVFFIALFANLAFTTGLVSYVIAIKRLSILLNILIGAMVFGERQLGRHLLAGAVMVSGAALITLS